MFKIQCIDKVHNHFKPQNTSYLVAISNVLRANVLIKFTIILNIISNKYIWPLDGIHAHTTNLDQSGSGSNCNEWFTAHSSEIQNWSQTTIWYQRSHFLKVSPLCRGCSQHIPYPSIIGLTQAIGLCNRCFFSKEKYQYPIEKIIRSGLCHQGRVMIS